MVNDLFPNEEASRILELPIGGAKDRHIWAYNDHGSYSVKIGYWFVPNHPLIPSPPPSGLATVQIKLKQRTWKIRAPPKIKMFLWRILSSALAVAERLNTREIGVDPRCRLCDLATEIVNHVLFRCSVVQEAWRLTKNLRMHADRNLVFCEYKFFYNTLELVFF